MRSILLAMALLLDLGRSARPRLTPQVARVFPSSTRQREDEKAEENEEQAAATKCLRQFGEIRKGVAASLKPQSILLEEPPSNLVQLTMQEVVHGLWHGNASILDLVDRGEAAFDDHKCDAQELQAFRGKFGLKGNKCFGKTNFGFGKICESGNVVWLYPKFDPSKAFCISYNACNRLTLWSSHACSVKVWRVETVEEATQLLSRYPDDSIKHVVLGGHGDGTNIRWGGKHDGLMGVAGRERPLPVGSIVRPTEKLPSLNRAKNTPVGPSHIGFVKRIDADGDAVIYFDGIDTPQIIAAKYFRKLKVSPSSGPSFLEALRQKVHKHGTIFTDSCLSATSKSSPNIAQFVAERVGKGVRVIGAEVSFGMVRVKRFHAWHGVVGDDKQRTYYAKDASCPAWAAYSTPFSDGTCRCPMWRKCRTSDGDKCPARDGTTSDTYFLPACAEEWSQERCECLLR